MEALCSFIFSFVKTPLFPLKATFHPFVLKTFFVSQANETDDENSLQFPSKKKRKNTHHHHHFPSPFSTILIRSNERKSRRTKE